MNVFVSGLVNIETDLKIRAFPVTYYPVDYPFFGIHSTVSGVAYNIAKAAKKLGDGVSLSSLIGKDFEAGRIKDAFDAEGLSRECLFDALDTTPVSVVLHEHGNAGKRQVYCDLKNIQDMTVDTGAVRDAMAKSDVCVLCNINFNRALLPIAKSMGKTIATDVHVLSSADDAFNREFMENADILFLSDEDLPSEPQEFILTLKNMYTAKIIVIGLGADGAIMYERETDRVTNVPAVNIGGVVNTVGAGDAMFTAFIHYYGKFGAVEALKRAEVFAALKIRHDGGSVGFSDEAQVEEVFGSYTAW